MKNSRYILLAVAVVIVVLVGMVKTKSSDVVSGTKSMELCYVYNSEAGDNASLKMTVTGQNITGSFNYYPAEKDKKTGTIEGILASADKSGETKVAALWWKAQAEGMTNTEELSIILQGSTATPGFGAMKDRGDGNYIYTEPSEISYTLHLQQTDCSDSALK